VDRPRAVPYRAKMGDYYSACMDEKDRRRERVLDPRLKAELDHIACRPGNTSV